MKQCKKCMNKPYKDKLFCCALAELCNAFNKLFREICGEVIKPFECSSRLVDERYAGKGINRKDLKENGRKENHN